MISYLFFLTDAMASINNNINRPRRLFGHGGYGAYGVYGGLMGPGMMGGGMYGGGYPMMNSSHGSLMNSVGSNMLNSGNYNRGSNYSNRNAWDRGYSSTDANSYNNGSHFNNAGTHGLMNSTMSNMGFLRRLSETDESDYRGDEQSLLTGEIDVEGPTRLNDEGETIDGQSFLLSRNILDTIASYAYPYMGTGGGVMSDAGYHHGNAPVYNVMGGYSGVGGAPGYNYYPGIPNALPNGSNSGYNNQNRMMNQGARQGYYDQGDVYQNQSGWDRGYNNTNSRSYRRGGMNDRHRSGMHQNQMGHNQNRMDYLPYNGGSYAGGMF